MAIDGKALTAIGIGGMFVWSGIKGWSVLGTAADLLTGKQPTGVNANPLTRGLDITSSSGKGVTWSPTTGANGSVATIALGYQGHAYRYGGAPGRNGENPWDCSSFVNFVVGVRLGAAIPGYGAGTYDGSSHGPPTGGWGVWSGLRALDRSEVGAGDIVVWLNHMGIALTNDQMISALNASEGTKVTPIDGYGNGPILRYGRLANAGSGGGEFLPPGGGSANNQFFGPPGG